MADEEGNEFRSKLVRRTACFTTLQDALFQTYVEQAGVSMSSYLVSSALNFPLPRAARRPTSNHQDVTRMLAELGRLTTAFREAKAAQVIMPSSEAEEAVRGILEMRLLCFNALGRKP